MHIFRYYIKVLLDIVPIYVIVKYNKLIDFTKGNNMLDKILDAMAYTLIGIIVVYGVYFYGTELFRIISENI